MQYKPLPPAQQRIQVHVRVRPPLQREVERSQSGECVAVVDNSTCLRVYSTPISHLTDDSSSLPSGGNPALTDAAALSAYKAFSFDHVGWIDTSQADVFARVGRPVTEMVVHGYNATIFAYGQTGSGKTFTIQGPAVHTSRTPQQSQIASSYLTSRRRSSGSTSSNSSLASLASLGAVGGASDDGHDPSAGLMPRVFTHMFRRIAEIEKESEERTHYMCQASFLEIYNNQIFDLLVEDPEPLQVRDHKTRGVFVLGAQETPIDSVEDAMTMLDRGTRNRHVGETAMNRESSRSHSVMILTVQSSHTDAEGVTVTRSARFNLVDLAGSERQTHTQASGKRLAEANSINKSLSTLGKVITALVESSSGKRRHIPYRDCKLTFLLKNSLGGNSLTYLIACVSPSIHSVNETLSTLQFAHRAKRIQNKAVVNEGASGSLDALRRENAKLRRQIRELGLSVNGEPSERTPSEAESQSHHRRGSAPSLQRSKSASALATPLSPAELDSDEARANHAVLKQTLFREGKLREQANELKEELKKLKELNARLTKQRQSTRMVLGLRERHISTLNDRLAGKLEAEGTADEVVWKPEVERLQEEVKQLREELKHPPAVLAKTLEVHTCRNQISELRAELKQVRQELAAARGQGETPDDPVPTSTAALRAELEEAHRHNHEMSEHVAKLIEAGHGVDAEMLVILETERQQALNELDEANKKRREAETRLRILEEETDRKTTKLEELMADRDRLLMEAQNSARLHKQVKTALDHRIDEIEDENEILRKDVATGKTLNTQLKTFLERSGDRLQKTRSELESMEIERDTAQAELELINIELDKYKQELARQRQRVLDFDSITAEIDALRIENDKLSASLYEARRSGGGSYVDDLMSQLEDALTREKALQTRLEALGFAGEVAPPKERRSAKERLRKRRLKKMKKKLARQNSRSQIGSEVMEAPTVLDDDPFGDGGRARTGSSSNAVEEFEQELGKFQKYLDEDDEDYDDDEVLDVSY